MPTLRYAIQLLVLAFAIIPARLAAEARHIVVASPDGALTAAVGLGSDDRLECRLSLDGREIGRLGSLGLVVDGVNLGVGARFVGEPRLREIDESYAWQGVHSVARNHCREAVIPCEKAGRAFNLILRVFADGVGLCYDFDGQAVAITGESTSWILPTDGKYGWSPYSGAYEELHHFTAWTDVAVQQSLTVPFTAQLDGYLVSLTEADCRDFPDMALASDGERLRVVFPAQTRPWTSARSPWRVTIIARDLTALVNSDIVRNLCPAPDPARDFSWVQPGRCLWQWWSVGAPKFAEQTAWIDGAAALNWEYYLIDDGWRNWRQPDKDQWQCLAGVVAYAKTKGVKSIVWVDSKEMRDAPSRHAYLEKVHALGADGIKIDFLPPATAEMMQWYQGALRDTADLHLLCNFHGAVKPTGQERTWPHGFTREAIRGHEYHILRYKRTMPLEMDSILPFTRFIAGAADYTPTVFEPAELRGYTWAHEFAQALVFTSPIIHFADRYQNYLANPAVDLLRTMPTVWDETRVLPGSQIGGAVGFARRKGDVWWIGVVNSGAPVTWELSLTFLSGPAQATLLADVPDQPATFDRREVRVTPADKIPLKLPPGGGFVARLTPSAP